MGTRRRPKKAKPIPRERADAGKLCHPVSTYLTGEAIEALRKRAGALRVKEAAYVRRLIEVDLGLVSPDSTSETDD